MLPRIRQTVFACPSFAVLTGCGGYQVAKGAGARRADKLVPVTSEVVRLWDFSDSFLTTSIATVMGAVPLAAAGGPGSASRATIGIVVIFGVMVSTFLSLFVVPAFYALLAPFSFARSDQARTRNIGSKYPGGSGT